MGKPDYRTLSGPIRLARLMASLADSCQTGGPKCAAQVVGASWPDVGPALPLALRQVRHCC